MNTPASPSLTPENVLYAYCRGAFPMADGRHGHVQWYSADPRAVIPMVDDGLYVPRSLRKLMRRQPFEVTFDQAFEQVIHACAEPRPNNDQTWINDEIITVYTQLHDQGFGHSCECWQQGELVGGVYGLGIGRAFFAESMFSRVSNASKVALVRLVRRLREVGVVLFDVQFTNPHLEQFGVVEISAADYMARLEVALQAEPPGRYHGTGGPGDDERNGLGAM